MAGQNESKREISEIIKRNPRIRKGLEKAAEEHGKPEFVMHLEPMMAEEDELNIIYPINDYLLVNVYRNEDKKFIYNIVETEEDEKTRVLADDIMKKATEQAHFWFKEKESQRKNFDKLLENTMSTKPLSLIQKIVKMVLGQKTVVLTGEQKAEIEYMLKKENIGFGVIDGLLKDDYIEDITSPGKGVFLVHKVFGNMETTLRLRGEEAADKYLIKLAERVDQRISNALPVAEGAMENGTRVSIIYGKAISRNGSSFSLRKMPPTPLSIVSLIKSNTISSEASAYLWLCTQNKMSTFVCGPSGCGKTTLMRAMSAFISPGSKIYSVESEPELKVPHKNWQSTIAKKGRADMFALLKASLRSRPDYIIIGQVLGKEASIAFQAMQTGHPVVSTFHGTTVSKVIQRLSGHPISIPKPFLDNLNIVILMQNSYSKGQFVRRVTAMEEIEGYVENSGVLTKKTFVWNPLRDKHEFKGYLNSYLLERKVMNTMGITEKREIYRELEARKKILERMAQKNVTGFQKVYEVI